MTGETFAERLDRLLGDIEQAFTFDDEADEIAFLMAALLAEVEELL